jgi:hypothetical protein
LLFEYGALEKFVDAFTRGAFALGGVDVLVISGSTMKLSGNLIGSLLEDIMSRS